MSISYLSEIKDWNQSVRSVNSYIMNYAEVSEMQLLKSVIKYYFYHTNYHEK